jgi:hypothetical protein
MIPYEELCAALERHRGNQGAAVETAASYDGPTGQTVLPPGEDTSVGVDAVYDDHSNELDIGDVVSDEEAPKN